MVYAQLSSEECRRLLEITPFTDSELDRDIRGLLEATQMAARKPVINPEREVV